MSLYYKCDCCGQIMHKLGEAGAKRLHLDIGELMDDAQDSTNKRTSWNIEEYPLIHVDLCRECYIGIVAKVRTLRRDNNMSTDLKGVSIGGKSV